MSQSLQSDPERHDRAPTDISSAARTRLDALAKPPGSLGRLERLAVQLAATQRTLSPRTSPRCLLVFAGDHGVVAEGVGVWPSAVTAAMIDLIASGRAASSALAQTAGADVRVIDVGSVAPGYAAGALVQDRRVGRGSASLAHGPALDVATFRAARSVGKAAVAAAADDGCQMVALGEVGIGNTTSAACLISLLTGADALDVVGPGAGATAATFANKRRIVAAAVARERPRLATIPEAAIAAVAGYEIAALAGAVSEAARRGVTVVLDGVVTTAAAMIAHRLDGPSALATTIAAHVGAEPAHAIALGALGLEGALDWQLRLGEGTGALLLLPMLDAAATLLTDVATLAEVTGGPAIAPSTTATDAAP